MYVFSFQKPLYFLTEIDLILDIVGHSDAGGALPPLARLVSLLSYQLRIIIIWYVHSEIIGLNQSN